MHALLCGPDLPTVAVVDCEVPLPADPWVLRTDAFEFAHSADVPIADLPRRPAWAGSGLLGPVGLAARRAGNAGRVTMDLEWATDGTPYKYRLTTRYEIPCTVSGSVTIDDTSYTVDSVPGQRDHSWGVRDWWGMDWIWSAVHLDDGTHLHGVNIRIPGVPAVSVGYVQGRDGKVIELVTVASGETFGDNGLPLSATLSLDPGGDHRRRRVRGHAPVSLVAPDGRVSQFPRAWVSVSTADGRTGVGWMEWNRNQPAWTARACHARSW